MTWTGPGPEDLAPDGVSLRAPVPPERWPFGPPDHHQEGCSLAGGGLFCDCLASDQDDVEWGVAAFPGPLKHPDDERRRAAERALVEDDGDGVQIAPLT